MNRLKKIILSCVLPFFCLLISVSYAGIIELNTPYTVNKSGYDSYPTNTNVSLFGDLYTWNTGWFDGIRGYLTEETHEQYSAWFNDTFVPYIYSTYNKDSYVLFSPKSLSFNEWAYSIYFYNSSEIDFAINRSNGEDYTDSELYAYITNGDSLVGLYLTYNNGSMNRQIYNYSFTTDSFWAPAYNTYVINGSKYFLHEGASIKTFKNNIWDGTYYYENSSNESGDEIKMPTNAEIAQAVQAFYNSDYYKNNKDFKEFFTLYNSLNGVYSFIGHNSVGEIANHFKYGSTLSQHIYTADYPSNTYGLSYWTFNLETLGSQISNIFNNSYWLYSMSNNGESITYNGKGHITDLVKVNFDSRYSTIVYSSTDYLCRIYDYENEEEISEQATIPGDQYTYDETLDPTTNEYNPLENFVPTDPTQSILGDVDFDEINKVFEENKNILDIENASWLFSANNQLINYFIGFLSFLIVLIIISRLLGG